MANAVNLIKIIIQFKMLITLLMNFLLQIQVLMQHLDLPLLKMDLINLLIFFQAVNHFHINPIPLAK